MRLWRLRAPTATFLGRAYEHHARAAAKQVLRPYARFSLDDAGGGPGLDCSMGPTRWCALPGARVWFSGTSISRVASAWVWRSCSALMDVHDGALFGEHALAYTLLSYGAIALHRRILWFPVLSQSLFVLPLLLVAQLASAAVRLWVGGASGNWWVGLIESAVGALLWPLVNWVCCCRSAARPRRNGGRCNAVGLSRLPLACLSVAGDGLPENVGASHEQVGGIE